MTWHNRNLWGYSSTSLVFTSLKTSTIIRCLRWTNRQNVLLVPEVIVYDTIPSVPYRGIGITWSNYDRPVVPTPSDILRLPLSDTATGGRPTCRYLFYIVVRGTIGSPVSITDPLHSPGVRPSRWIGYQVQRTSVVYSRQKGVTFWRLPQRFWLWQLYLTKGLLLQNFLVYIWFRLLLVTSE